MRTSREQNWCPTLVSGLLALAAACASSRSGQREAEVAAPVAVPVAQATLAPSAAPSLPPPSPPADPPRVDPVERMLSAARAELGKRGGREGIDCSTFVRSAYSAAGVDLYSEASPRDNGVQAIRRYVLRHGRLHRRRSPTPGDLVFFDNSYDRNRNRLLDDRLTHVGIVEEVLADGTALVLHSTNHGVVREPMNLRRPHARTSAGGEPINAVLRRRTPHDSPRTPRFMSELFAGFGTVFGAEHLAQPVARRPAPGVRRR
ncbi:MAG: C40 family peptidase [Myxococcales bacterium]